jgi:APA family basic amino acid/polyamine antiporter
MAKVAGLGLPSLVALVVANMIGAGVFTTSGFALGDLGSPAYVLLAWVVGGLVALCGALSYGALARLMPVSGGEYLFLSRTVHPLVGFIAGWISLLAGFTAAIAFTAITLEAYLVTPRLAAVLPENSVATMAILLAGLAHGVRRGRGVALQNLAVLTKLVLIVCFLVFAFGISNPTRWEGVLSWQQQGNGSFSPAAFALAVMWISFSYSGFNAAVYVSSEASDPALVPRSIWLGTLLVTVLYLALNAVFVFAPAPEVAAYREDVATVAALALGGDLLASAVSAVIVIALFTSVSAMVMAGPRVYARMAEDGLMPRLLNFRGEVPTAAVTLQSLLAIAVVWAAGLRELLSYLGFTLGLSTVITVAALFTALKRQGQSAPALPGYPWAPALFVILTLLFTAAAAVRQPLEMLAAVLTIASGTLIFFATGRHRLPRPDLK